MPRHLVLLALAAAAAAAMAGCGSDDEASTGPQTTAVREPGPIRITRPAEGARVRAEGRPNGGLAADVSVAGRAEPGEDVVVNAGCHTTGCVVRSTVRPDGSWRAELRLTTPPGDPEVRLTAVYSDSPIVGPQDGLRLRLAVARGRDGGGADAGETTPPPDLPDAAGGPGSADRGGPRALVMIGDSLAEGTEPLLPDQLPGWTVRQDARRGRTLAEGMSILESTDTGGGPVVLAFSLFTNDDPRNIRALESAVRLSVRRAGASGCAVWATIARPPFGGVGYRGANAALHRLDAELGGRLVVVPWAEQAAAAGWLAADRVHATPAGYGARAAMYAEAARSCGG